MVERSLCMREARGSIPRISTMTSTLSKIRNRHQRGVVLGVVRLGLGLGQRKVKLKIEKMKIIVKKVRHPIRVDSQ
ncbi:unnamed protein product [Sphenostylis stenocarpa]|uniref:Uncharacterized protein n=1 Tax=Sphenostylis stenocarpa TaxID=92480 RepID=A0AA86T4A1_9FABA|nr:unnamed protein product [Sphenostylis stenocarpa]